MSCSEGRFGVPSGQARANPECRINIGCQGFLQNYHSSVNIVVQINAFLIPLQPYLGGRFPRNIRGTTESSKNKKLVHLPLSACDSQVSKINIFISLAE